MESNTMRPKGMAISQTMYMLIAIMVLAVLAYLLYTNFVSADTRFTAEECRVEAINECVICTLAFEGDEAETCPFDRQKQDGSPTKLAVCMEQGNLRTVGDRIDCTKYLGPNARDVG